MQGMLVVLAWLPGLLVGVLVQGSIHGFVQFLNDLSWLDLAVAVAAWSFSAVLIMFLPELILRNETKLLGELSMKKQGLVSKLHGLTAAHRASRFYLNRIESEAHTQIENTSRRERSIRQQLLYTERIATEVFKAQDPKREVKTIKSALEKWQLRQKMYEVKLLEIKILRLHRQLQGTINRREYQAIESD